MISAKNLSYYYDMIKVILNIHFEIPDGQIVGILGNNGAGKTTLLKIIAGIFEPESGSLLIDGKTPKYQPEQIAFITEEGSYFPYMTPRKYGIFLGDFFSSFSMDRYEKLLHFFDVPDKSIKKLSKGQKMKVEVAAGYSKMAKYIIMDEPFSGKDLSTRSDFLKLMATTLTGKETVLISTHLIDVIENFIDRMILLNQGKIISDVMIDDLKCQGKSLRSFLEEASGYDPMRYKELMDI